MRVDIGQGCGNETYPTLSPQHALSRLAPMRLLALDFDDGIGLQCGCGSVSDAQYPCRQDRFIPHRARIFTHAPDSTRRKSATLPSLTATQPRQIVTIARQCGIGGGVGTALACDMRIAADGSKFGIPAAKLGLGYAYDGIKKLIDLVGPAHAREIFYTARQFTAEEALRMGLVNQVVPDGELEGHVDNYCAMIAANAPLTVRAAKVAIREGLKDESARDLALCKRLVDECFASQDYAEGRTAFMEKRKPVFQGR